MLLLKDKLYNMLTSLGYIPVQVKGIRYIIIWTRRSLRYKVYIPCFCIKIN